MRSPAILAGIFNHVNSSLTTPQRYETNEIPFTNDANAAGAHPTLPTHAPPRPSARCLFLMGSSALLPPSPPRGTAAVGSLTAEFHRPAIGNCPRRQDIALLARHLRHTPIRALAFAHPSGSMHRPPPTLRATMTDRCPHPSKKKSGDATHGIPALHHHQLSVIHFYFFLGGRLSLPGPEGFPVALGRFLPYFGPFVVPIAISPPQNQRPSPLHPRSGPRCSRHLPVPQLPPAVGPAAPHCRTSPAKPAPTRCSNDR